ncbi:hypothetical protein ACTA71_012047 [Dictyostelium dimigraforme]
MELENNKNKPKKYFLHREEEYINRKPVFKSYKSFYPSEMEGVFNENEYSDLIRKLNFVMNNNPPLFLEIILKLLISLSAIISILFVGNYGARILRISSIFASPRATKILVLIMIAIGGPTILIFISFIVYKQISQSRFFKNINKSLEKRSIKINNLGNHAIEIEYFQQSKDQPQYEGLSETSSLLNNNIIFV